MHRVARLRKKLCLYGAAANGFIFKPSILFLSLLKNRSALKISKLPTKASHLSQCIKNTYNNSFYCLGGSGPNTHYLIMKTKASVEDLFDEQNKNDVMLGNLVRGYQNFTFLISCT